MGKPQDLKNKLATKADQGMQSSKKPQTVEEWIKSMAPAMNEALPKHIDIDRFTRIAMTQLRTNPVLRQCSVPSLLASIMQCAQLGLEPGLLGHAYLVPYNNRKLGTKEVQFIIGYKGLIELARRSGNIESIAAHEVCENDEFVFEYGLEEKLIHKPALKDRGKPYLYYAYAKFKGGGHQIEIMTLEDIEKIRKRSKASDNGPWQTDYDEMAKKTIIRRLSKYLPISVEVMRGIEQDETVKTEISSNMTDVVDLSSGDYEFQTDPPTTDGTSTPDPEQGGEPLVDDDGLPKDEEFPF